MNSLLEWCIGDWHHLMPTELANVLLTTVAVFGGALVGAEREKKQKPTGTRTLALVSLGACVFTILSEHLGNHDGHIAANIISGIGFLGAGVIIHGRYGIVGLTSAATIWAMAAVGMTIGAGYAGAGMALSVFVLVMLSVVGTLERRYIGPCRFATLDVSFDPAGGKSLIKMEEIIDEFDSPGMKITHHEIAGNHGSATVRYCCAHQHHREVLARLAEMAEMQTMARREGEAT